MSVDKLAQDLTTNSTALKEMGFGMNTAIGFMANLNKNGIDSSAVMSGLKKALQNATKDGKTMSEALDELSGMFRQLFVVAQRAGDRVGAVTAGKGDILEGYAAGRGAVHWRYSMLKQCFRCIYYHKGAYIGNADACVT